MNYYEVIKVSIDERPLEIESRNACIFPLLPRTIEGERGENS